MLHGFIHLLGAAKGLRGHYDCAIAEPDRLEPLLTEHHGEPKPVHVAKRRSIDGSSPRH